jgi:pimeloyl-ACP methyl ester carboxylesterase
MLSWLKISGKISTVNGINLWNQTFGKKDDPCFLLIMGAGCQGILWTNSFCKKLAGKGFFVIRYDARDTGRSSYFDYQKQPYTLLEMAKDAVGLLEALDVRRAHVLGTSMGGAVAQLLAAYFPDRVLSLTLVATTSDWRNVIYAMKGLSLDNLPLSSPTQKLQDWIQSLSLQGETLSWKQKLQKQFEGWRILNGSKVAFDKRYYQTLFIKSCLRQRSYKSLLNHAFAIVDSLDLLLKTKGKIKIPTLIIQGEEDPIFQKDHAVDLANSIPGSELLLFKEMGHNLNACFHDSIIGAAACIAQSVEQRGK